MGIISSLLLVRTGVFPFFYFLKVGARVIDWTPSLVDVLMAPGLPLGADEAAPGVSVFGCYSHASRSVS